MDLKPSNIVLTKEPEIELLLADNVDQVELKLIDFGAAQEYKAYERFIPKKHPTIMDVDKPVFTPYYAAPEVVFKVRKTTF
jgi:serine/threonine protein kinase